MSLSRTATEGRAEAERHRQDRRGEEPEAVPVVGEARVDAERRPGDQKDGRQQPLIEPGDCRAGALPRNILPKPKRVKRPRLKLK